MQIKLNGEERKINNASTLGELIKTLGLEAKVMAAAVNMEIVKKEAWDRHRICEGDRVELLHFVGGG